MCRDVFATDRGDLNSRGSYNDKLIEYVKHVQLGLATLGPTPLIYPALGVDLWKYRNFGERYYVEGPVGIPPERITAWGGAFRVDGEALCFPRSVLPSDFRYRCRAGVPYWDVHGRAERQALSVLGRFVPYHLRFAA